MDIVFYLSPGSRLLQSNYPIEQIWALHQTREDEQMSDIHLHEGAVKLIVWRQQMVVKIDILSDLEYAFLNLVTAGKCFSPVCEQLISSFSEADIGSLLGQAIEKGWIQGFYLETIK
jgi:hypothetical protein